MVFNSPKPRFTYGLLKFPYNTMNQKELASFCPGVDFNQSYKSYSHAFSIGDYTLKYLQKTFQIIKSSSSIENDTIVDFIRSGIKDHHLPFDKGLLIENLKCSAVEADDFLRVQSSFFAVSFQPLEYKILGAFDSVPFVVDSKTNIRPGGYGMVEKETTYLPGKLFEIITLRKRL